MNHVEVLNSDELSENKVGKLDSFHTVEEAEISVRINDTFLVEEEVCPPLKELFLLVC